MAAVYGFLIGPLPTSSKIAVAGVRPAVFCVDVFLPMLILAMDIMA